MNPARTLGPCVILHSFYKYHWVRKTVSEAEDRQLIAYKIYWVGPILGALLATSFYKFIKILEYETANPGQDSDDLETLRQGSAENSGSEAKTSSAHDFGTATKQTNTTNDTLV